MTDHPSIDEKNIKKNILLQRTLRYVVLLTSVMYYDVLESKCKNCVLKLILYFYHN